MNEKVLKRKVKLRVKRKLRIRSKIEGTAILPRVSIFRSNRFIYAQAIDDTTSTTLASINAKKEGLTANKESATKLGASFAKTLKSKDIDSVVFDRNGYKYHGVVAAFGDALRDNEIKF